MLIFCSFSIIKNPQCHSAKIWWPCFYYRRQQEATSVSARQDSWAGTARFRETAVPAVRVGTAAAVMRCWMASFVTARRASPVQPVRWGLDQAGKRAVKKTPFCKGTHLYLLVYTLQVQNDPCSPNPCHNKAQCHNLKGDFYCSCPDDYEGKTCSELKDHCKTNHCQGNTWWKQHFTHSLIHHSKFVLMLSFSSFLPQWLTAAPLLWQLMTLKNGCGTSPPMCAAPTAAASACLPGTSAAPVTQDSPAPTATKVSQR